MHLKPVIECGPAERKFTMRKRPFNLNQVISKPFITFLFGLLAFALAAGCTGSYGRVAFDENVADAFKTFQVPPDYKYYYYGVKTDITPFWGLIPNGSFNHEYGAKSIPKPKSLKKQ